MLKSIEKSFDRQIEILPLGDIHFGARGFDEEKWNHTKEYLNNNPEVYLIMVGDESNMSLRHSCGTPWDDCMTPQEQVDWVISELTPYKERILAAVGSNHFTNRVIKDTGINISKMVYETLGCGDVYRDGLAPCRFEVEGKLWKIWCAHGNGGGMRVGGAINRNEQFMAITDADLWISGHVHKPATASAGRLVYNGAGGYDVVPMRQLIVPSYLGYSGYAEMGMLLPSGFVQNSVILTKDSLSLKEIV